MKNTTVKRKATEFLNKIMAEYEAKETQPNTDDILFTDYLMQWLEKKKSKIDPITWQGYRIYVEKHIVPFFESKRLKLSELKPRHISDYYDFKFTSGRLDGKPGGLAVRTIKSHSLIIKEVLDDALVKEIITKNVAAKVPLPKQKNKIKKETFLNTEEANQILSIFKGHHLQPLIYVTLYYGLRRSEVLGLKWSAIDFKNDKIKINHTVVKHNSRCKGQNKNRSQQKRIHLAARNQSRATKSKKRSSKKQKNIWKSLSKQ